MEEKGRRITRLKKNRIQRRVKKQKIRRRILFFSIFIIIFLSITFVVYENYFAEGNNPPLSKESINVDLDENTVQSESNGDNIKDESNKKEENDILILVNKKHPLSSDYAPEDLVVPDVSFSFKGYHSKKQMRKEAATALEKLFAGANDEGIKLYAVSGYRPYERQKNIFNNKARKVGEEEANKVVAYPGQSEHQTGLAIDVSSPSVKNGLVESFGDTKEGIWLKENSYKYGFIIRYPKEKEHITGYSYEPWHIRYIGKEAAEYIFENDITLEEYILNK